MLFVTKELSEEHKQYLIMQSPYKDNTYNEGYGALIEYMGIF